MKDKGWLGGLRKLLPGKDREDPAWPAWYTDYFRAFRETPADEDLPLTDAKIIVLDAETTGLDPQKDRLLSLGAMRVLGRTIYQGERLEFYLPSDRASERQAVKVHGIVPNSRRYDYTSEEDAIRALLRFVGPDGIVVGHHIGFDLNMVNRALERLGAGKLRNPVVDTAQLAQRLQPPGYWTPPQQFALDELAKRYRIPLSDRHTALGDAYITAILWLKLTARLEQRVGRSLRVGDL